MTLTAARQVADAVLYEGYLLYPYRASSSKNHVRWQFGVLGPEGCAEAGVGEPASMSCEVVLVDQAGASIDVLLRFLQVQSRTVERWTGDGWQAVPELSMSGVRWIPFHEAVSRELALPAVPLGQDRELDVAVDGGEEVELLHEDGALVGRLVRTRWALSGTVTITSRPGTDRRLRVLSLAVRNRTSWSARAERGSTDRDVAARYSFVGTHLLMTTTSGARFVSLLEGPEWSSQDAASCGQSRCWPVLVADDDGQDAVLVSPIILGDHPAIAPESAGDLFDATEIDEILTLRVMTMTEQEKAEARGTDPRAAQILARCDSLDDVAMGLLHGARRPADATPMDPSQEPVPWWDAGQDARADPENDVALVRGVGVRRGSRVLLRPSRRADAQDLFLAGLTAVVTRVYEDVDGRTHIAVMLEDDPGSDLYSATGRYYYFAPDELEPLPSPDGVR